MPEQIKVLIAEDHNLFRKGIVKLIHEEKNIFVIGEASSGKDILEQYKKLKPDLILSDISMPGGISGFEAAELILKHDPKAKILFLSMYSNPEFISQARKIGARGLINKNVLEGELILAIHTVAGGDLYFGSNWSDEALNKLAKNNNDLTESAFIDVPTEFTYREVQIIVGLGKGLSSSEIAQAINLSKSSVDVYRANLMKKLKLKSVNALVAFSVRYILSHSVNDKIEKQYESYN